MREPRSGLRTASRPAARCGARWRADGCASRAGSRLGFLVDGALAVPAEAPGAALHRDAAPGLALLGRRHHGPMLDFVERAAAALADVVALARRADRDA